MTPITVIVPCKNELPNIAACLDSLTGIADELLVGDSGSTDGTLELVQARRDCRVIQREYVTHASFLNWCIPQAKHEWVLVVDADECATPELIEEIRRLKQSDLAASRHQAYFIGRRNRFLGREIRFSGWQNDGTVRLSHKTLRYKTIRAHTSIDVPVSEVAYLQHRLMHNTFRGFEHYIRKVNDYTTMGAQDLHEKGTRATLFNLVVRPLFRFVRHYVLQRGMLDGREGFIISVGAAYSVFLKYAKLYELRGTPTPQETPSTARRAA